MTRQDLYRQKIQEIDASTRTFQAGWKRLRSSHSAGETYRLLKKEYAHREQAVVAFYELLAPLWQPFLNGDSEAIDAALDFLEIDIPAFRVGYAREWFYRRLKRTPISARQRARLLNIAYALFSQPGYRREALELSRLLIVVADGSTIDWLERLGQHGATDFIRRRAKLALEKLPRPA